ncbi:UNVERIFIED_CONTAM: hypothetical protein Slati_3434300 [Sesamum latifolium]|uniref:Endonuclease/exonuclease/phosphatase domain-containing protein n=1 Tax=Sesamum latifolium TaxID=2727402 RepID=A0AAW2UGG0_9LAMI
MINLAVWNVRGLNRRDHQVDVNVISVLPQIIHCSVLIRHTHISVLVSVVYGANDGGERRQLWESLAHLAESIEDEPWLVMGDFNTVADLSEVCGNCGDIRLAMEEFQDCISQTGLITLPMQGDLYTWHNRSTGDRSLWKRLDRMLVNDRWLDRWPETCYDSLHPRTSDHAPLFLPTVQRVWGHSVFGTAMYSVTRKLKALKPYFRNQRKQKGDLSLNVRLAKEFLATVQELLRQDRHDALLLLLESCCRLVYLKASNLSS